MAQRRGGEPAERRAAGKAAALLAGGLLLALLLSHAGIGPVLVRLRALGWGAPLVLVPYLVIAAFDALGWRGTLPATARVPLGAVYLARMAGEAVNSLTPTAVTGEPLKAHLLRAWGVSSADGVASIVIAKTALTVSQILFILLGIAARFDQLDPEVTEPSCPAPPRGRASNPRRSRRAGGRRRRALPLPRHPGAGGGDAVALEARPRARLRRRGARLPGALDCDAAGARRGGVTLPERTLGRSGLRVTRLGLGLAAVGRPAYINLGRARDLPAARTPDALFGRTAELLDAAYAAGIRYVH